MSRTHSCFILLVLLTIGTSIAGANRSPKVAIIANPEFEIQEISAEDLKSIFLGRKISLKGASFVKPVVESGGATHSQFLKSYLGKTESALQTYYRGLVFSGEGSMPATVASDAEAVAFVGKTRGAIGYVDAAAVTDKVKILRVR